MKKTNFLLALGLSLGLSNYAFAVCNGSSNCENPAPNGSAGSWTASASGMTGIQALNSVGPTGNDAGSRYFFAAATTNLGATVIKGGITTTGDGLQVIGSFALNSGATPGSTVTGGVVPSLLGSQPYFFYTQACPSGALLDSARCSQWVQVGTKSTLAYPVSVFLTPVRPADASINTISARTNVPNADLGNISQIQFEVDNLISGGLNQTGILIGWPGVNQSNVIDNSLYTAGGGFKPNVKYQYKGQVFYPYGVAVPTGGSQLETNFWTTPANPAAVVASNVTHCSAQITANNSAGSPANPAYTNYNLCATGTAGACAVDQISGATPTDTAVATVTGLNPNTLYTPQATALVGNGDGTSSGWNNSGTASGSNFTTLAWGGVFTVNNETTNSADFNVSGITGAGSISSWAIKTGGSAGTTLASGSGDPTGIHPVSGLTPNTVYGNLVIVLTETSGCSSTLNFSPASFTTTPLAPTNPSGFSNVVATSLQVNWTNPAGNSAGTQYRAELCTDAGFSAGCQNANTTAAFTTFSVSPNTTYFARVKALNRTGSPWLDSAYLNIGSVGTPTNQSSISVSPNPGNAITGNPLTFTATVTDQTGAVITNAAVNWSYSNGNSQLSTTNGHTTNLTATSGGSFTLTASLGGVYADVVVPVNVSNSGPAVATPMLVLNPDHVTGNLSCSATDPGYAANTLVYNWSVVGAGAAVTFSDNNTNAAKNAVVTFTQAGTYTFRCTVTDPASVSGSANTAPTLLPQSLTSISVSPNNVTISVVNSQTFTASGKDQFGSGMSAGSVSWTSTAGSMAGGTFHSVTLGSNIRVTATNGGVSGSATVNVVNYDVSSAYASPVPYKSTSGLGAITFRGLGSSAKIRVYTATGRKVFSVEVQDPSGLYSWNVKNNSGESLASGVYLYVIESPTTTKHGKLIIIQ